MQPNGEHTDTYKTLKEFAAMEDWDYVMLQGTTNYNTYDKGLWNVNPANTANYWTTLKNGIAEYAPNAKRLVNATWSPINELVADFNGGIFAGGTPDALDGFTSVRKAHCMYGWDWGPRLPDAGIWRDVFLEITDRARFQSVLVRQQHEKNKVILSMSAEVTALSPSERCKIV